MSTFLFSPGIKVYIDTVKRGVIDVSDDINSGSITLSTAPGGHSLNLTLINHGRKYDGMFTPNDRFVVWGKRLKWMKIMAGYLTSVPQYSVYANSIKISGHCTLKRLRYRLWDKGARASVNLINSVGLGAEAQASTDSNMAEKITAILSEVAEWPKEKIHIGDIPIDWWDEAKQLYEGFEEQFNLGADVIGTVSGGEGFSAKGYVTARNPDGTEDVGPLYGQLPYLIGKVKTSTNLNLGIVDFDLPVVPFDRLASTSDWWCAIRAPFRTADEDQQDERLLGSASERNTAEDWWTGRKMLVWSDLTRKGAIVAMDGWGPYDTDYGIVLSDPAREHLGVEDGDITGIRFAEVGADFGPLEIETSPGNGVTPSGSVVQSTFSGGPQIVTEDGLVFTSRDNIAGHVAAARDFVNTFWPDVLSIGGWRAVGSVPNSRHPRGLALDIVVSSGEPTPEQVALGNSIAYWFCQNPDAFGVHNVIWNNQIYDEARGVRPYIRDDGGHRYNTSLGHRDHVHVGFKDPDELMDTFGVSAMSSLGPMGNGWNVAATDFFAVASPSGDLNGLPRAIASDTPSATSFAGNFGGIPGFGADQLINATNWRAEVNDRRSALLVGDRALINDDPIIGFLGQLFKVGMRDWMAAPNGDLIAWWPDYFNMYGTCARLVVRTVELEPFNIQWSDENMVTHQFVVGNYGLGYGTDVQSILNEVTTHGIANVEMEGLLQHIINANPDEDGAAGWWDPEAILARFGPRANVKKMDWLANRPAEFWMALHEFRLNWAGMFSTSISTNYMPEAFPGMILQIPEMGIQFYIESVSHSFNLAMSGGYTSAFRTTMRVIAPSTIGAQEGLYGLPRGGRWVGTQHPGPALAAPPPSPTESPENDIGSSPGGVGGEGTGGGGGGGSF